MRIAYIIAAFFAILNSAFALDLKVLSESLQARLDWTNSNVVLSSDDFKTLENLSKNKNPLADFALGVCLLKGINTNKDYAKSLELLKRASEEKNDMAMNAYAICLSDKFSSNYNKNTSQKLFKESAELGNISAVASRGFELAKSKEKVASQTGIIFLKSAMELGNVRAKVLFALCYENAFGVEFSRAKALELLESAMGQGSQIAPFYKAKILSKKKDPSLDKEIFSLYKISADAEFPEAIASLGECYMYAKGVEENFKEAISYLKKASDMGVREAMNNLGVCYANGIGIDEQNAPVESFKLFMKAAELGEPEAQNNLANCYYFGKSTPQDYKQAFYWYNKAARNGNASAQSSLALCYLDGQGVEKNPRIGVIWLKSAAQSGDIEAQSNLGKCYLEGIGTDVDYTEAVKWLSLAAKAQDSNALANLGACYYRGLGVDKNESYGKSLIKKAASLGNEEAKRVLRLLVED